MPALEKELHDVLMELQRIHGVTLVQPGGRGVASSQWALGKIKDVLRRANPPAYMLGPYRMNYNEPGVEPNGAGVDVGPEIGPGLVSAYIDVVTTWDAEGEVQLELCVGTVVGVNAGTLAQRVDVEAFDPPRVLGSENSVWKVGSGTQLKFYVRLTGEGDPPAVAAGEADIYIEVRPTTA